MSNITADTLMPLISALPESELHALREKLNKMVQKKDRPKKARKTVNDRVADQLGEMWRKGNEEMFISHIMNG